LATSEGEHHDIQKAQRQGPNQPSDVGTGLTPKGESNKTRIKGKIQEPRVFRINSCLTAGQEANEVRRGPSKCQEF
jgi:hypothetical protein